MRLDNEQWVSGAGGDCTKCRRQKYCKNECSEHMKSLDKILKAKGQILLNEVYETLNIKREY